VTTPTSDIQKLSPSALIELFELDATNIAGGQKLYFHNGTNIEGNDVVWKGITYERYPIEAEGFEKSSSGSISRPTIRVANITGLISTMAYQLQDLIGAKVTRRRTFYKYLDAVNYPGGVNAYADPNAHFPDESWSVDRKSSENAVFVEFELSAAFDVAGVYLPRRQCIQNLCTWRYRGAECGYTGTNYWDYSDQAVGSLALDTCGKRLSSCEKRFGVNAELPYGGFPGVGLTQ
jgi:lambda family phage minor tail protein L